MHQSLRRRATSTSLTDLHHLPIRPQPSNVRDNGIHRQKNSRLHPLGLVSLSPSQTGVGFLGESTTASEKTNGLTRKHLISPSPTKPAQKSSTTPYSSSRSSNRCASTMQKKLMAKETAGCSTWARMALMVNTPAAAPSGWSTRSGLARAMTVLRTTCSRRTWKRLPGR